MEKRKILSPKLDIVFHMIFGEQKHERITKKLIEDVIGEKVETIELEQTPYLWGNQADDKLGIIDVRATINNKNPVDIEMQIIDNQDIEKRILFYWSKLYLKQLKRGEKYIELNRSISIIFLDYKIKELEGLPIHTKWQIKNTENGKIVLTEDLEIHIIELPKIRENLEEGRLKKWILFLENPEGEETKKMAEEEKEIKEAIETLEDISSDEANMRMAELREKFIADREAEMKTARRIGLEKGIEEGREKGIEEGLKEGLKEGIKEGIKKGRKQGEQETLEKVAKNLKNINVSIDKIMEVTGLTKEKIERL